MRAYALRLLSALLALSLSACVKFANGVVDKPLANDERLIGSWEIVDEKHSLILTIAADGPASVAINVTEDRNCDRTEHFTAVRTRIDDRDFLDIYSKDEKGISIFGDAYRYEIHNLAELAVFPLDLDSFTQAVVAQELPGEITRDPKTGQITFTQIDASTAELRQWIAAHPAATHGKPLEFIRRDPASAPHCG